MKKFKSVDVHKNIVKIIRNIFLIWQNLSLTNLSNEDGIKFSLYHYSLFSAKFQRLNCTFPLQPKFMDTLSPASLGWCHDKIDTLLNFLDSKNTKAFIVLKDGKIVIEHYFDTFTVDSLWYWASAGKSLTSFLVGMAKQDGFLNLSDSTSQYLGSGWTICPPLKKE